MVFQPKRQLPGGVVSANEQFFDALIRHQIGLLRLTGSIREDVIKLLNATEADMADKIRSRLLNHQGLNTPRDIRRMQRLIKVIRLTRLRSWDKITARWISEMRDLARAEPVIMDGILRTVVPVTLETTLPSAALLQSLVTSRPFEGKTMRQWARSVSRADLARIEGQIKIGMLQGESSAAIARRVVGTRRLRGRDGATAITRRQAAGITRTAVMGISNQARREFYLANEVLFTRERYVATLDHRTTPICQSLDGEIFPLGEGPYPPIHFMCRSLRVAIIDDKTIGNRPARAFTERMLLREFSRDQGIKAPMTRGALPRGTKGKFDTFKRRRMRELTGTVPAKVSYQEWLGRQSAEFQDDVLGRAKGRLFRRGKLPLDRFVDKKGSAIPLSELAKTDRQAFIAAGLDPEKFL